MSAAIVRAVRNRNRATAAPCRRAKGTGVRKARAKVTVGQTRHLATATVHVKVIVRAKATVPAKVIGALTQHRAKVIVHERAIVRARADQPRVAASVVANSVPVSAHPDLVPADSAPVAADLAGPDLVLALDRPVEIGLVEIGPAPAPTQVDVAATVLGAAQEAAKPTVPARSAIGRVTTMVLAAQTASGAARMKPRHTD